MWQAFHIGATGSGITPTAGPGAEGELPVAFANGKGAVDGVVDDGFT